MLYAWNAFAGSQRRENKQGVWLQEVMPLGMVQLVILSFSWSRGVVLKFL